MSRLSEGLLRSLIGKDLPPILRSSTGGYRRAARQDETGQDESQQPEHEEPLQEPLREPSHRHLQSGDSIVDSGAQGEGQDMVHCPFVWSDEALRLTGGVRYAGFGPPE